MGRAPWGGPHGAGAAAVKRSMKTSDLHIAEGGRNGSGPSLRSLLGLDWLGGGKKKQKTKFKAGTHPSAGGQPDAKTKVSQSAADVLKLLRADRARRVGVFAVPGRAAVRLERGDVCGSGAALDVVGDTSGGSLALGRGGLFCSCVQLGDRRLGPDAA